MNDDIYYNKISYKLIIQVLYTIIQFYSKNSYIKYFKK